MIIRRRKGFDIELMLKELSKDRTVNEDGSISYSGFGVIDEYETFFRTSVVAEGKSDAFVKSVIRKALNIEQDLSTEKFIQACNRIAHQQIINNLSHFKVVFPLWGYEGFSLRRRRWDDVSITFDYDPNSSFCQRAKSERTQQLLKHERITNAFLLDSFPELPLAICSVKAIGVRDAFEQSEKAISKELGLYSLFSGRGQFIINNGPDKPINTVLLGPYMTVHSPTGKINVDIFWYNKWVQGMTVKSRPQNAITRIQSNAEQVRRKLRKLPWRSQAELALTRYFSAFGQFDLESSFLDGWRLLEAIGGHSREKSETLVKRAAWFFEDRERNYQIGLHLMHRRHLISHGRPIGEENNERLAYQMKEFLFPFLRAYLTNPFNFRNIEEFWDFCDLPVKKAARMRQTHILECARKFRRET